MLKLRLRTHHDIVFVGLRPRGSKVRADVITRSLIEV